MPTRRMAATGTTDCVGDPVRAPAALVQALPQRLAELLRHDRVAGRVPQLRFAQPVGVPGALSVHICAGRCPGPCPRAAPASGRRARRRAPGGPAPGCSRRRAGGRRGAPAPRRRRRGCAPTGGGSRGPGARRPARGEGRGYRPRWRPGRRSARAGLGQRHVKRAGVRRLRLRLRPASGRA